jgi:hypothetical protein
MPALDAANEIHFALVVDEARACLEQITEELSAERGLARALGMLGAVLRLDRETAIGLAAIGIGFAMDYDRRMRGRRLRACRVCGCTDLHACPGGCYWVAEDLCSACAAPPAEAAE